MNGIIKKDKLFNITGYGLQNSCKFFNSADWVFPIHQTLAHFLRTQLVLKRRWSAATQFYTSLFWHLATRIDDRFGLQNYAERV